MLTNVHVKNFALIEEAEVNLSNGFNILTGETGAGKSIIIDSINYCLGAKAERDVVREGAEYALIELTFYTDQAEVKEYAKENDIPCEDDGMFILTRKIMDGRSQFKVNGEATTAKKMKELAVFLIDIHGQHEHQSLLSEKKQKLLLDGFGDEELSKELDACNQLYHEYKDIEKEIDSFDMDEAKREREIALAQFEVDEIENAAVRPGEEEELATKHNKMVNGKKIAQGLSDVIELFDGEGDVLTKVGHAVKDLSFVAGFDQDVQTIESHMQDAEQVLLDVYHEIKAYMEDFSFDMQEFAEIEERLDLIRRLSLKYGKDEQAIIEYGEKRKADLQKLIDSDNYLNELKDKKSRVLAKYETHAKKVHDLRCKEALSLSNDIQSALKDLNFLKVEFNIEVDATENYSSDGYDDVRFLISLNPGEKLKPISDVASGGELSRIMLALKTVLASRDGIESLIFDEIDTGISGVTAWQVSRKMGYLSRHHQIICITHLPQIAAMADTHFKIEKSEKDGKTVTNIIKISGADREKEVARLLGSEELSKESLANAASLIKEAEKEKK